MTDYDVWFTRLNGELYAQVAEPDEAPLGLPRKVSTAARTLELLRVNGHTITQVGICDPEMLGLDFEV